VRVVCPFVTREDRLNNRLNLQPQTAEIVRQLGGEFIDCSSSEYSYFAMFRDEWRKKQTFCIIEQDVVPTMKGIESLQRCNHLWCGCPYFIGGQYAVCLGCTRFDKQLMVRYPNLPEQVSALRQGDIPPTIWWRMDVNIAELLMKFLGHNVHNHSRHRANHLKVYG
jgi:hypothetical protein